jgi:3-oxoacyl-[acyl-carrier protein] reductase
MDLGLKGRKALVCGGSKGLGYATAEALVREHADVYLLGREEASLKAAAVELSALKAGQVRWSACDLLSHESRQAAVENISTTWGALDILIHNVGGPKPSYAENTTLTSWQEGFERLLLPVIDLNSAFLDGMKKKNWGRIVTVTSLSVVQPIPMLAISNALRSASTSLSKTLSSEVAKYGITVNCVAPGSIATDRTEEIAKARISQSGQSKQDYENEMHRNIPVGRLGRSEEYGAVVCFLCSNQASYITGSTIYVDGGSRQSTY